MALIFGDGTEYYSSPKIPTFHYKTDPVAWFIEDEHTERPAFRCHDIGEGDLIPVGMAEDVGIATRSPTPGFAWAKKYLNLGQEKWKSDFIAHPDDHPLIHVEFEKPKPEIKVYSGMIIKPPPYIIITIP